MTGLDLSVGEELSSAFEPCLNQLSGIAEQPAKADNALSKINMDYGILFRKRKSAPFEKRREHATTTSHLE
jgi:hypothetical protein